MMMMIIIIVARDNIYAIVHICYRPSVHLSVIWVDQSKNGWN